MRGHVRFTVRQSAKGQQPTPKGGLREANASGTLLKTQELPMLNQLTKKWRVRAAIGLAVAFALCVVSPAITLALTHGAAATHCLSDDHHRVPASYTHDASHPQHDNNVPGQSSDHNKGMSENCCGLFCVTAGAIPFATSLADPVHATTMNVITDDVLQSRATDRIDRPPRSLLSL